MFLRVLCVESSPLPPATAAVRLRLELERVLVQRSNERLIIDGDDDDARVGDGVAAPIFVRVVADERAARDEHVAVDDRASDARVAADPHARHKNAFLDAAEAV